jgi:hypothetical protein
MPNSLGPTMDKKEQIVRWTALIEKYTKEVNKLKKETKPTPATTKRIKNLEHAINEFQMLIKDNLDFLASKERRDNEMLTRYMERKTK